MDFKEPLKNYFEKSLMAGTASDAGFVLIWKVLLLRLNVKGMLVMIVWLKKIAGALLPKSLRDGMRFRARVSKNFNYDMNRFREWSGLEEKRIGQMHKKAMIIKEYHRIEKGMSFEKPKIPFGVKVAENLLGYVEDYIKSFESDSTIHTALDVISEYIRFHKINNSPQDGIQNQFERITKMVKYTTGQCLDGGYVEFSNKDILSQSSMDLQRFFNSRYSIRNFSNKDVAIELIEKAVGMARKTPSVCNRQASKVHFFSDKTHMSKILRFQNGNTGFGHQINKLLIVTSDLRSFLNVGERYQCWVDGGMFAMSLIYALHSLGLGTCCLNWSVEFDVDQGARKEANIPDSESIIMFIAVGYLPERFKVAHSKRKELSEYLIKH